MLGFADDAGKIAVTDDGDETGDRAGAVFAEFDQFRARVVRPQHAAVQHARQRLIVDEARPGEHLVGNIDPLHRMSGQRALRRSLRRYARRSVAIERNVVGQFPIAGPDIAGSRNGAVLDAERIDINTQPFRSQLQKDLANLRAGVAQRAAGLLDRETARGNALVGARGGRSADHLHAGQIDIEFVGGDLRQRGHDALSDLDLARRHRHLSRVREFQPRRQFRVRGKADRQFGRGGRGGLPVHPAAISFAARSTARTMRLCEPQRQRLRSSASLTSRSVGDGFRFNSAAALIRMPEMQ